MFFCISIFAMTHTNETTIKENLLAVNARIHKAAATWQRETSDITLVAVSKFHPTEALSDAIAAGQFVFGENRVQEAYEKWPPLKAHHPQVCLHLIGPLQTNKVKQALELFDVIETIDRPKLVDEIIKHLPKLKQQPSFYVQVNIGEEAQKGGVMPAELNSLLDYCAERGLPIAGLMCIPPAEEPPAPYFALLNSLARRHKIKILSMGMSGDFEQAISLGATHVRVGTAIFGQR